MTTLSTLSNAVPVSPSETSHGLGPVQEREHGAVPAVRADGGRLQLRLRAGRAGAVQFRDVSGVTC